MAGLLQQAEPDALASLHDAVVDLAARPLADEGGLCIHCELATVITGCPSALQMSITILQVKTTF